MVKLIDFVSIEATNVRLIIGKLSQSWYKRVIDKETWCDFFADIHEALV